MRRAHVFVAVALAFAESPAHAHNGSIAIVRPVSGLTVDGALEDWPAEFERHPIAITAHGQAPRDARDLSGSFVAGYSEAENSLWLAVQARDDSIVIDSTSRWDTQDGCCVFLDLDNGEGGGLVSQFNIYGEMGPVGEGGGRPRIARAAWTHVGGVHTYEWRIDVGLLRGNEVRLARGLTVGLDVALCDRDADGSYSWVAWGRGSVKVTHPERLGDGLLVGAGEATGALEGSVTADGVERGLYRCAVLLDSHDSHTLHARAVTDDNGDFSVRLPVGSWRVHTERHGAERSVRVTPNESTRVPLEVGQVRARVTPAGSGTRPRPSRGTRRGEVCSYGIPDGLPDATVTAIIQASDGALWIGTAEGVSRHDGREIFSLTGEHGLPIGPYSALLEDRDGSLWIGAANELCRYDGATLTRFGEAEGLPQGPIRTLFQEDNGRLWVGCEYGLGVYDGTGFGSFDELARVEVRDIAQDALGRLWFATAAGVYRVEDGRLRRHAGGVEFVETDVRALAPSTDGMWIGTVAGLWRSDGEAIRSAAATGPLPVAPIWSLATSSDGALWIGAGDGLWTLEGTSLRQTLPLQAHALHEDAELDLWIGTDTGLYRFEGRHTRILQESDGLASSRTQCVLTAQDESIWVGSAGGVTRIDAAGATSFTARDGLLDDFVLSLMEDRRGVVWVGTRRGVNRIDAGRVTSLTTSDGLVGNIIAALLEDSKGRVWAGAEEGVSLITTDPAGLETITNYTTADGLIHYVVSCLAEDALGNVWIGSPGGVSRWDGSSFARFSVRDGLRDRRVYALLTSHDGRVWAGTGRGLHVFESGRFECIEQTSELSISSLAEDHRGHIWMGTGAGVRVYDGMAMQSLLDRDGLAGNAIRDVAVDSNDLVWIATSSGLTRYAVRHSHPRISITDVVTDRRHGPVTSVTVPSTQPTVVIEFHATSHKTRRSGMIYRYRLRSVESDGDGTPWELTRYPRVEITDLSVGRYAFEVQAIDRDLSYSEEAAVVELDVRRPWGEVAMIVTLGVSFGLLGWLSIELLRRGRRAHQLNAELARHVDESTAELDALKQALSGAVAERHRAEAEQATLREQLIEAQRFEAVNAFAAGIAHDFNSLLGLVAGHADLLEQQIPDTPAARKALESIREASRQGDNVTKALLDLTRSTGGEKKRIHLGRVVAEAMETLERLLPPSVRKVSDLAMDDSVWIEGDAARIRQVIFNLATNACDAMPSGGVFKLTVTALRVERARALLIVEDSGSGVPGELARRIFDPFFTTKPPEKGTGLGLSIVQAVVHDHGGTITVESHEGQGTRVTIALPAVAPGGEDATGESPSPKDA